MATARLRLYPRPEEDTKQDLSPATVPIKLADLYPLLCRPTATITFG